jgi:hypothetical protein
LVVKCRKGKYLQAFGKFARIEYRTTEFGKFRVSPVPQNLSTTFHREEGPSRCAVYVKRDDAGAVAAEEHHGTACARMCNGGILQ